MKSSTDEMWDGFIAYVQSYDNPFIGSCAKKRLIIDCDTSLLTVKAQKAIKLSKAVYIQDLSTKNFAQSRALAWLSQ